MKTTIAESQERPLKEHAIHAEDLISRIVGGEFGAEEEMCVRYGPELRCRVRPFVNRLEDIDDLVNNVWCVAIPKLRRGGLEQPERLVPFLSGIARRIAANDNRKTRRHNTHCETEMIERIASDEDEPSKHVASYQFVEEIARLLDELPARRDRDVLRGCFLEHRDRDAVRREFGLRAEHFSKVLSRARSRARSLAKKRGTLE